MHTHSARPADVERRCARLARASFRLEMAELERLWAIVSAHREEMSIREIAKHMGLGPTRTTATIRALYDHYRPNSHVF